MATGFHRTRTVSKWLCVRNLRLRAYVGQLGALTKQLPSLPLGNPIPQLGASSKRNQPWDIKVITAQKAVGTSRADPCDLRHALPHDGVTPKRRATLPLRPFAGVIICACRRVRNSASKAHARRRQRRESVSCSEHPASPRAEPRQPGGSLTMSGALLAPNSAPPIPILRKCTSPRSQPQLQGTRPWTDPSHQPAARAPSLEPRAPTPFLRR